MFKLLNSENERKLAIELVADLLTQVPPADFESTSTTKLSVNKISRALERVNQRVLDHHIKTPMGIIRKSVLANNFKWGLRGAGYNDAFVDMATQGVLMELAKSGKKRT